MSEYEAKYYPQEKSFMLVRFPYKGTEKTDGKEIHRYGYEVIYDGRSDALKALEADEFFDVDENTSNTVQFNWKGEKSSVYRVLLILIFSKSERIFKSH